MRQRAINLTNRTRLRMASDIAEGIDRNVGKNTSGEQLVRDYAVENLLTLAVMELRRISTILAAGLNTAMPSEDDIKI